MKNEAALEQRRQEQRRQENADILLRNCLTPSVEGETVTLRFEKEHAKRWLLEDKTVTIHGTVRWLQIKDIGLGIVEVRLRPIGKSGTYMFKMFETA